MSVDMGSAPSAPRTARLVRLGQHHLPPWAEFEAEFEGIFERRFFANNGPLVVRLDERFGPCVGAQASVAVTNEMIGFAISARALGLTGPVAVPANASLALVQGLVWGGATPVLVDVDMQHEGLELAALLAPRASEFCAYSAVLTPHRPGISAALRAEARRRGLPILVDATGALGCEVDGEPVGAAPHVHVFSFHSAHIVNGGEGAAITTHDPHIAERLRFCRSFHAASESARVSPRINGKMAEAPAALILRGLDVLAARVAHNQRLFEAYRAALAGLGGVSLVEPTVGVRSNYEACLVEFTAAKTAFIAATQKGECVSLTDQVVAKLRLVGIESARPYSPQELIRAAGRGAAPCNTGPWPVAEAFAARRLALPLGAGVTVETVTRIVGILARAMHELEGGRRVDAICRDPECSLEGQTKGLAP